MSTKLTQRSRVAVGLCMILALSACGRAVTSTPGDAPNLREWTTAVETKPAQALEPLPVLTKFEPIPYATAEERDPFSPKMEVSDEPSALRPDDNRRKQPLEEFALDSLKMVGTMGGSNNLIGLVMAPDKITYRVQAGDYLGQNNGKITAINAEHITIVEVALDGGGSWIERPAGLDLGGKP